MAGFLGLLVAVGASAGSGDRGGSSGVGGGNGRDDLHPNLRCEGLLALANTDQQREEIVRIFCGTSHQEVAKPDIP